MPSSLLALPAFKINGPFWNADADLVRLATPTRAWAFRDLYVDLGTRDYTTTKALLPGTMMVLCWVRTVRITPNATATPTYTFTRSTGEVAPPETLTPADIKRYVLDGTLALLLVQADPAQWKSDDPTRLGTVTCTAGHIALDVLRGDTTGSRAALYRALAITEQAPAADRPGAALLPGALSVHASGMTVYGQAKLPWENAPITAPFQVTRVIPDPNPLLTGAIRTYRLTVETERLVASEQAALTAAWGRLAAAIDPGNPALGLQSPSAPRWATLEVANPKAIPRMYWFVQPWQTAPASLPLHVEREELNLVLSDQARFDRERPATTVARTLLDDVKITRTDLGGGAATVTLDVTALRRQGAGAVAGTLRYDASAPAGSWIETAKLSGVLTAPDPTETPRLVRESLDLAAPDWAPGTPTTPATPVDPAVLWGFVPLEDGWAQLPIPNLTDQAYLDAQLGRDPLTVEPLLSGAVSWGNDKPGTLAKLPSEQPWSLTLLDADALSGAWTVAQASAGAPLQLSTIALTLSGPELSLNGLLWLATGKPSAADALPTVDDWVSGLRPVALRTVDDTFDVLPPLLRTAVPELTFAAHAEPDSFPWATLDAWSIRLEVDAPLFKSMLEAGLLPETTFSEHLPLAWRRHRTLPMVQALPLTQSSSPPSHPSASRQLAPFELPVVPVALDATKTVELPSQWTFGRPAGTGASAWPLPLGPVTPAREWSGEYDLPLSSLSLPGLVLDPKASTKTALPADAGTGLPQQYRHDLPYVDEVHALAQLPKIPRRPDEVSPAPDSPLPAPPQPLSRETLGDHWHRLSERASLAALDAVAATTAQGEVKAVVEPLAWPVSATVSTAAYPGSLTLANTGAAPAASATLTGEGALKGLTGGFVEDAGNAMHLAPPGAAATYDVVAGSMAAAALADGRFRDQRGLARAATSTGPRVLRTRVKLADVATEYDLTTLREAVPLAVGPAPAGGTAPEWRLWFRDLPVSGTSLTFDRTDTRSPTAQDVNDPDAGSRAYNHLNGFEWRVEPATVAGWKLFGLDFYPLTLEKVTVAGDGAVTHVELVGRLQIPVDGAGELEALANAVKLTFEPDGSGALALVGVNAAGPGGDWPLGLSGGEAGDAPRIAWTQVALAPGRDALWVDGAALVFQLFGADWRIPLDRLVFDATPVPLDQHYVVTNAPAAEALPPREVALHLDVERGKHVASFVLGVRLGRDTTVLPARPTPLQWSGTAARPPLFTAGSGRVTFAAELRYVLLGDDAGKVTWERGWLFEDMLLDIPQSYADEDAPMMAGERALEFRWRSYALQNAALQLVAGAHVAPGDAPGFNALAFTVLTPANDSPILPVTSLFAEALVRCRWGEYLQDTISADPVTVERVCGSSAGDLAFGYTAELTPSGWVERHLLNGFVEVKDLVSWPLGMTPGATTATLTLPAARASGSLEHLRHTIRILFDQHVIPTGVFDPSASADLVFQLGAAKGWNFLAVVEHQLVEVKPGATFTAPTLQNDRRWVAVQEVRLLSPASLKADLLAIKVDALKLQNPVGTTTLAGDTAYGYLGTGLRALLAEGTTPALDGLAPGTLLVEASAVHWLKELPLTAVSSPVPLQYLPGGTQLASLSRPEDYAPTDPRDPAWLLLEMPFLGRLQDQTRDAIATPATPPPLLQVDPVLDLHRRKASAPALPPLELALTSWAESTPFTATFASFDAAVGRTFSRLEPRALEESWFWLHFKVIEPSADGVQSVLASAPETPARLGRPAALAVVYDANRKRYPPDMGSSFFQPDGNWVTDQLMWRIGHLLVLQAVSSASPSNAPPYGWLATGLQLATGLLPRGPAAPSRAPLRHVAASLPPLLLSSSAVPSPVVVSPFLSLELRPAPTDLDAATELRVVVAELLGVEAATGRVRPVATQQWELGDRAEARRRAAAWAREIHRRLTPDSPIAVLRYREIRENVGGDLSREAVVVTSYGFDLVPGLQPASALARRVFRLRSKPAELRFRDGRFGGDEVPEAAEPFELAPPQAVGVQPVHLGADSAIARRGEGWPWGLSALRTTVKFTDGKAGVAGRVEDPAGEGVSLWWQALPHAVQFRSGLVGEPAAGLPPSFRARAIRSLLPVLPDPPLPAIDAKGHLGADAEPLGRRQPILPGAVRTTLLGARAGAFLSLRPQLIRQGGILLDPLAPGQTGHALVSGSVPVQHRAPRPVPLPANAEGKEDVALRTWASRFEPTTGALVRTSPADEAYFAATDAPLLPPEPAHRLRMKLVDPHRGELPAGWDGRLSFDVAFERPEALLSEWVLTLRIQRRGRTIEYPAPTGPADGGAGTWTFALAEDSEAAATLADLVRDLRPGELVSVDAVVGRRVGALGFRQTLSFALRLADADALRLPLAPAFALFEDPEYNRLLASSSKRAVGLVSATDDGQPAVHAVTLATDRAEYDPDGQLAVRFDWDDDTESHAAALLVDLVDPSGALRPLALAEGGALVRPIPMTSQTLKQLSLLDLREDGEPLRLSGGETLALTLRIDQGPRNVQAATTIVLGVNVALERVVPAAPAAYALLRKQTVGTEEQVECVRFAWSPPATRIELVNPADLRTEIVRRRAVFLWTDTARAGAAQGYAVQKIARSGSTHFPVPDLLERVPPPTA
jgi:hypothetical protein